MGRWPLLAAVAAVCLLHALPVQAKRAGTHFLVEIDAGACLSGDAGPAASVAFGAGGKFKGFAPRFYVLGSYGYSEYSAESVEEGGFSDLALGPRMVLPIIGPLRWFIDGSFGASYATGRFLEPELAPLAADEWLALARVSTGLQLRLIKTLSLGMRVGFAFNEAGLVGVSRLAGVHDPFRTTVSAGVTWHF
jgi:hypothetical protein